MVFQILNMCEQVLKLPLHSIILEYPNQECLHLVIPVGSTQLNEGFALPQAFVTWDSNQTSALEPSWSHRCAKNLKIMPWFQDFSHPGWFVPYMTVFVKSLLWTAFVLNRIKTHVPHTLSEHKSPPTPKCFTMAVLNSTDLKVSKKVSYVRWDEWHAICDI